MKPNPLAGKPASLAMLANIPKPVMAYCTDQPDFAVSTQRVAFGTSGHVLAISLPICPYRTQQAVDGPLFLGIDTHALSEPACASAFKVLAANGVEVMLAERNEYTATPTISHAMLTYNLGRDIGLADGILAEVPGTSADT